MTDSRIEGLRRLLAHVGSELQSDLAVRLWDGSTVPLGPKAPTDGVALAIRSPDAITRMLRRPRLGTIIELFAAGKLAIEGGTLLDLAAKRGETSRKGLLRRLDKLLVARALWPFLFGGRDEGASHAFVGNQSATALAGRDEQGARPVPLRPVERLLRALPRSRDGLFLRVFPGGGDHARRSADRRGAAGDSYLM
jgi:cyclopropane-fatty-acyl-phospholipid synthase